MNRARTTWLCGAVAAAWWLPAAVASAQQVTDPDWRPPAFAPAFATARGPTVCVDERHRNFHTLTGRFRAFGALLRADGFRPRPFRGSLRRRDLVTCRVLVIANAQPGGDDWNAYPYPTPSAFTDAEAATLRAWVEAGGSLLLIADHMPFPGAAAPVAAAFGFEFNDGFAVETFRTFEEGKASFEKPTMFDLDDGTLREHPITRGATGGERVTRIRTFTGQAFTAPPAAAALLVLPANFVSLMPRTAWKFSPDTPRAAVGGWLQGAVMPLGRGRLAVFGEAGMFTAQLQGEERRPMGLNAPGAEQNWRLVLNLLHWLSRSPAAWRTPLDPGPRERPARR